MRVGITTAADAYERYATTFASVGLEPVHTPSIEIQPTEPEAAARIRSAARSADLLVITSARAISFVWELGSMPSTPTAAVGRSTAHAVSQHGGTLVHVGRSGGVALSREIGAMLRGATVTYPHAEGADPRILQTLAASARSITAAAVYRSVPFAPPRDAIEVVVFASPSAVAGWFMGRTVDGLTTAVIGPTTSAALARRGHRPHAVASSPTLASLATAVADYLKEKNTA